MKKHFNMEIKLFNKLLSKTLSKETQDSLVQKKLDWILACCSIEKIILFGSACSYEMTDSSDIDLILIFEDKKSLDLNKIALYKNRPQDDWPHDLIFHTVESYNKSVDSGGGAAYIAHKEGRVIYNRGNKHES